MEGNVSQYHPQRGTCQADWDWADTYIPAVKQIIGPYLLQVAPLEVDMHCATDFMLIAEQVSIACRIRDFKKYYQHYSDEFTIRLHRDSGAKTEFAKILEGWGTMFFYGFGIDVNKTIPHWYLMSLDAFRYHYTHKRHALRYGEKSNGDGTSFMWFHVPSFPKAPPLLIASSQQTVTPQKPHPFEQVSTPVSLQQTSHHYLMQALHDFVEKEKRSPTYSQGTRLGAGFLLKTLQQKGGIA